MVAYVGTTAAKYQNTLPQRNTGTITTASFTAQAGELIVVKACGQAHFIVPTSATNSGTVLAWREVGAAVTTSMCASRMWVARAPATATMTVTVTFTDNATQTGNAYAGIVIAERYSNAFVPETPNVVYSIADSTSPFGGSITPRQQGSIITWSNGDWNQAGGTSTPTRTYVNSSTTHETGTARASSSGVEAAYFAYQTIPAGLPAAVSFGMTAPTAQSATFIALELQPLTPGGFLAA